MSKRTSAGEQKLSPDGDDVITSSLEEFLTSAATQGKLTIIINITKLMSVPLGDEEPQNEEDVISLLVGGAVDTSMMASAEVSFSSIADESIGLFSFASTPTGGTTYMKEQRRMEEAISDICSLDQSGALGHAGAYDLCRVLSSANGIANLEGLESSIWRKHQHDWNSDTLRRIVNEAPDHDGNGVTATLCSRFLLSMHAASSNDHIQAFIAILHGLVAWLYLNYDPFQSLESEEEEDDDEE